MASKSRRHDRQLSPIKDWFRSRRSPNNGEAAPASRSTSPNPASQASTNLQIPRASETNYPIWTDKPAGSLDGSLVSPATTSSQALHQTVASSSVCAVSDSASSTRPPEVQSQTPAEPRERDLWAKAAGEVDPQTLEKWYSSDPSQTAGEDESVEPPTVSSVLELARERARLQHSKIWKQRWLSLVKSVSTFKSLVDAGLQFDPTGYGALAWTIVSFGLEAAISNTEIDDYLVESCEYIRAAMDEYAIYEARYLDVDSKGRKALENCVVDVYKAVIRYAAEMSYYIHHRSDRISKAVKGSSESSFIEFKGVIEERRAAARTIIADIRNELSESRLDDIMSGIDTILARANDFSKIVHFVDEQEREKVLSWLSVVQMDTVHVTQRDKAEADDRQNPGVWILSHTTYLQWEGADKTSSLWLTSGVGTGKTILTSTVIEARVKDNLGPMGYFYCSGTPGSDAIETTAENILKCLLRQFATCSDVAFSLVATKWKELKPRGFRTLTRMEVLKLLNTIIEDEQTLEATIIVDGLDELNTDDLRILLDSFATLLQANCGILKVFVSSRWAQRIEDIFSRGFRIDDIASETRGDMQIYIESALTAEIRGRHSLDGDLVDDIRQTLLERAKGMFRYIELAIKYIFDSTTNRIRERLEDLPQPASGDAVLRPMYEKLYEEIEKEDPVDQLLAYRVIQWLLHQILPLTDKGLLKAISFGIDSEAASRLHKSHVGVDEVKAACHHLVTHNAKIGRFEFGHISVVEFIHWKSPPVLSDLAVHSTLAAACLSFLVYQDPPEIELYGDNLEEKAFRPPAQALGNSKKHSVRNVSRDRVSGHNSDEATSQYSSDEEMSLDDSDETETHEDSPHPFARKGAFEHYSVLNWAWHWHEASQHTPSIALQHVFDNFWNHESRLQDCIRTICFLRSIGRLPSLEAVVLDGDSRFRTVQATWTVLGPILLRWDRNPLCQRWLLACGHDLFTVLDDIFQMRPTDAGFLMFVPGIKLAVAFGSTRLLELTNSKYFAFTQLHASGTSLLHHAANLQNTQSTRKCLELFPDAINLRSSGAVDDEWVSTPFLMGLQSIVANRPRQAQPPFLKLFLEHSELDVKVSDKKGRTALHLAAEAGLGRGVVDVLLERDPTAIFRRDIDGWSGMTIAAHAADHSGVETALLSVQAQTYPAYDLHNAARTGDIDALDEALLNHDKRGQSAHHDLLQAFFFAAENQNMGCMKMILRSPYVDVNDQDEDGFSALIVATIAGKDYAVRQLRLQNANVVLETSVGRNALFFAIRAKRLAVLKLLLHPMSQSPFDINHRDSKTGRTILHYVCEDDPRDAMDWAKASKRDMLSEILSHKPNMNIKDRDGKTARDIAAVNGYHTLLGLLDTAGASQTQSPGASSISKGFTKSASEVPNDDATGTGPLRRHIKVRGTDANSFYSFESLSDLFVLLTKT